METDRTPRHKNKGDVGKMKIDKPLNRSYINKLIKVKWNDSLSTHNLNNIGKLTESEEVGWLIDINKKAITLTSSKPSKDSISYDCYTIIPRSSIYRVRIL
jgi:hypothetical protein